MGFQIGKIRSINRDGGKKYFTLAF